MKKHFFLLLTFFIPQIINVSWALPSVTEQVIQIKNENITYSITIADGQLLTEALAINNNIPPPVVTDADFSLEIVWADWLPPGKSNHGDNPANLSKKDFEFVNHSINKTLDGGERLELNFAGINQHLTLQLSYQILPNTYYLKRSILIKDPIYHKHLLHLIKPLDANLISHNTSTTDIVNQGGFGQPVGVAFSQNGLFFGLEYPAGTNTIVADKSGDFRMSSKRFVGQKLSAKGYQSNPVVIGLTPDKLVKHGFMGYLNDIKSQPLKPYTLYNSWYDLRGRGYTVGQYVESLADIDYMSESNVNRLYDLIKKKFIDPYGLPLDAFVLDDGWDIYGSDWKIRPDDFPDGVSNLVTNLNRNQTDLGMWFGPTGGYSDRMQRINWYRDNGFEVTGEEKKWGGAQLCLAGQRYRHAFESRNIEFTQQGVNYYKWDGIQFSCNETDHGHPIGLYSQTAVLDTVIDVIDKVTEINPNVYHSITSGTWLSPWWLMHANQIWMQGEDYGYASVPSINRRDASITYRDSVLYDDLKHKNLWFPVSNMMTHGIIKGKLENLHVNEPLDKFTDNAMLYFARGVSMYELYTSPDIMSDDEWRVLAQSMLWAKQNFTLLMNTEMVGGDPAQGQAYAYVHFDKSKGIIAVRNPAHYPQKISINLSPAMGMSKHSDQLLLEKTYPYQYLSKDSYQAGDTITLDLDGYETSIYEIYAAKDSQQPLLAGVPFYSTQGSNGDWNIHYFASQLKPELLNIEQIHAVSQNGQTLDLNNIPAVKNKQSDKLKYRILQQSASQLIIELDAGQSTESVEIGLLLTNKDLVASTLPLPKVELDKKALTMAFEGTKVDKDFIEPKQQSGWYSSHLPSGSRSNKLIVTLPKDWQGNLELWAFTEVVKPYGSIKINMKKPSNIKRQLPPSVIGKGSFKESYKMADLKFTGVSQ